ncbi:hypothetical protein ACLQ2R_17330 [Streptosporangium sp. DT93]|uniref:hypothetical protein n=1 Tax=Streptosporangium sp. DT93 TaxID=3393428 RepID=UPI003CF8CB42
MSRHLTALQLAQQSSPSAPPSGYTALTARSGDLLYTEDSGGVERLLAAGPAPVRLTSTVASNATALSDATGLGLAVQAGRKYLFRFAGQYVSAASTTGLGLAVNGPTLGSDGLICNVMIAHTNAIPMLGAVTAYNTAVLGTASSTATRMPWEVWGLIHVSAAGTLQLRIRSEVASSAVTLQIGSYGYAWAVG